MAIDQDDHGMEDGFRAHFAGGVDVVLDYLWGAGARNLLVAAAQAGPEARPIRFVQIGSSSGADIAMPAAVLRSSALVMMGSGLGSISLDRLTAAIKGVLDAAATTGLTLDHRTVPLAEVASAWAHPDAARRIVFLTGR